MYVSFWQSDAVFTVHGCCFFFVYITVWGTFYLPKEEIRVVEQSDASPDS